MQAASAAPGRNSKKPYERPRLAEARPFPSNRRLVKAAMHAGRRRIPMYGLVEVDVTDATRRLGEHDPPLSLTAFIIASVARAAAAHPDVHAYRDWRGRLVTHRHVDVGTMVEITTEQGPFPLPFTLRDADVRSVAEMSAELHEVKRVPSKSAWASWVERAAPVGTRIPGLVPALYTAMSRSVSLRQQMGTVAVTSVGMFAQGGGFGLTPLTLMSLEVVVGGMSDRPRVLNGRIEARRVLDLTIIVDHNVVDGAPAARFGADFRRLVETAEVLVDVEPWSQAGPSPHDSRSPTGVRTSEEGRLA